jgi:hypothetical protein
MHRPAASQVVDDKTWSIGPGASVSAFARSGNTLYLAGSIVSIGPSTGTGLILNGTTGSQAGRFPKVSGPVQVVVADGAGGWFIGGGFTGVGGHRHPNLAHILSNGTIAPWTPNPDGSVVALAVSDGILYVGGDYHRIGGMPRRSLAAFNIATGRLLSWAPEPDGSVWAILVAAPGGTSRGSGSHLQSRCVYIGGDFSLVDGQARSYLAAVDLESGRATSWNPQADYKVHAFAFLHDTLFVGGRFYHIGGQSRRFLAAVDAVTGELFPWNANVGRTPDYSYDGGPRVLALGILDRSLYVAGAFSSIGGQSRNGLAAVDLNTGSATDWNPRAVGWGPNHPDVPWFGALAIDAGSVFVGGEFSSLGGRDGGSDGARYAGAIDARTAEATPWNPRPNGIVGALAAGHGRVYAGGGFTSAWDWVPRHGLAAVDLTTGAATSWAPITDGIARSMAVSGNTVYIAGEFWNVAGQPRSGIAAIGAVSGEVTPWNPNADGWIYALAVNGSAVYVGGWFTRIGGQDRYCLAAIDSASGMASGWNPHPNDIVLALSSHDSTVYAGGFFTIAGGARRGYLAALDNTTGEALPWIADADNIVDAIAVSETRVYAGGSFSTMNGAQRLGMAAIDRSTGTLAPWTADADQRVCALAVDEKVVYAGGYFTTIAGQPRSLAAAMDANSGALLPWAPAADRVVLSILPNGSDVYLAGAFQRVGVTPSAGFASVRVPRPTTPPLIVLGSRPFQLAQNVPNPVGLSTTIQFEITAGAVPVSLSVFDLQGRRVASLLADQLQFAGAHEVRLETTNWPQGCYLYRIDAGGFSATRKMVVVR